jgi:hypothetical protein
MPQAPSKAKRQSAIRSRKKFSRVGNILYLTNSSKNSLTAFLVAMVAASS